MAPRKRFNPVEFYRKAASTKPLSVAAPKTRRTPATTAQLSPVGHLFDKAAPLIADYITAEREKEIRSADEANAMKMMKALTDPQAGDAIDYELDAYLAGEPVGADLVRQQANLGAYDMPDQTSWLAKLFGAEPPKGQMGDRSRDVMMQILLGDKTKRDAAELLSGERAYKKEVAEALAASKLAAARAKLTDDPTSNMRDFKELQRLQVKYPPINGKDSPEVATFKDFVRATKYKDTGRTIVQMRPGEPPIPSIKKQVPIEKTPGHVGKVAAAKAGGAGTANRRLKDYSLARNATNNIKDIDMLISRLHSTDEGVVGFLVDLRVFRDQALAKFGSQEALARVTDTQMVNTLTGREVFPLIKALGIGARGLDTPAERKFLREVLTGDKGLTKATLLEMAAMRRKVQVRNIERWNKDFKDGSLNDFLRTNKIPSRPFTMPPPAPVYTPIDITGSISQMDAVQISKKLSSNPSAEERKQIDRRLKVLGF